MHLLKFISRKLITNLYNYVTTSMTVKQLKANNQLYFNILVIGILEIIDPLIDYSIH